MLFSEGDIVVNNGQFHSGNVKTLIFDDNFFNDTFKKSSSFSFLQTNNIFLNLIADDNKNHGIESSVKEKLFEFGKIKLLYKLGIYFKDLNLLKVLLSKLLGTCSLFKIKSRSSKSGIFNNSLISM